MANALGRKIVCTACFTTERWIIHVNKTEMKKNKKNGENRRNKPFLLIPCYLSGTFTWWYIFIHFHCCVVLSVISTFTATHHKKKKKKEGKINKMKMTLNYNYNKNKHFFLILFIHLFILFYFIFLHFVYIANNYCAFNALKTVFFSGCTEKDSNFSRKNLL